ncbi:MAG TPA: hypothetical protein VMF06_14940 [Candidatus Limnocylindria bacterium]|nr:hypothetical protein [Candidatus Limnocylindria bacterium]
MGMLPSEEDRRLIAEAEEWPGYAGLEVNASAKLAELSRIKGLEYATAVLYNQLQRRGLRDHLFQRIQSAQNPMPAEPVVVGLVPGAFHREHQDTGADGVVVTGIVNSLGYVVETIPVSSFGALSENASAIACWLAQHRGRRVALLSLSKGSADLKKALSLSNASELFRDVTAWVSISGLSQGTPLVGWLRRQRFRRLGVRLLLALRRQRYSVLEELRHESDGPLAVDPVWPPHLRIIHLVACPLRRHLAHRWAPRAYERLAPLGPNDGGGVLLGDTLRLPGTVYPVWGADHYLQPFWEDASAFKRVLSVALGDDDA